MQRERERERGKEKYKIIKNMGRAGKDDGFRKVKEVMPCHVQRYNFKAYDCHARSKD